MDVDRRPIPPADGPVAVVLSGAGARGAFQAGALAELIPALAGRGVHPTIWLGTSAGSINATLWAAALHAGPEAAAERVLDLWRTTSDDEVYRPLLPLSLPWTCLQYAAGAVLGLGSGTTSLLDTGPLRRVSEQVLDTAALAANLVAGVVDAVGVVTTRMPEESEDPVPGASSGRSVLFLAEREPSAYAGDPRRALDVVRTPITAAQVLASSAIPVAFPPVRLTEPAGAAGWYLDGGVRLNTPLQPAIGLGATRLVVVSATSTTYPPPPPPGASSHVPDVDDAAAQVLNSVLADRTTEELAMLRRMNRLVGQATEAGHPQLLRGDLGRPYRRVEVLTVSPPPGEMGRLATRIHAERTGRLGALRETDNWLLGRLIRGAGDAAGRRELLSYLFFDEVYFTASIELGRQQARQALVAGWQT